MRKRGEEYLRFGLSSVQYRDEVWDSGMIASWMFNLRALDYPRLLDYKEGSEIRPVKVRQNELAYTDYSVSSYRTSSSTNSLNLLR